MKQATMKWLYVSVMAVTLTGTLTGCMGPWFAAKTLSVEEIQAMKELMSTQNISGCIAGGADAAYVVQAGIRVALCAGKGMDLTVSEAKQLMNGINVQVSPQPIH